MYYLAHLAFPALVVIVMLASAGGEISLSGLERASEHFVPTYLIFALPHLVWTSATSCFEASKATTVGGFIGAHLLLVGVWVLVATSSSREAVNGWFFYLLGSPITVVLGAIASRKIHQWHVGKTAA